MTVMSVSPILSPNAESDKTHVGSTGLRNVGNTCFMNSILQALLNSVELKTYFCNNFHYLDINVNNPLGMKGELALAFGTFMEQMWSGQSEANEPSIIKHTLGRKMSHFSNDDQHDAHEFLSFVLDLLHEDLNRVLQKTAPNTVDVEGLTDSVAAKLSWEKYKTKNDSIIVDLFHGLLKSQLRCRECEKISITFDPFVYLALPFPKVFRQIEFYFFPNMEKVTVVKLSLQCSYDSTIGDLFKSMTYYEFSLKDIHIFKYADHRIIQTLRLDDSVNVIRSSDTIFVFEVLNEKTVGENVLDLLIIQRKGRFKSHQLCSFCFAKKKQLKPCVDCYQTAYCDNQCQQSHWFDIHKDFCKKSTSEFVGAPFVISIAQSEATYDNIVRKVVSFARLSTVVSPTASKIVKIEASGDKRKKLSLNNDASETRSSDSLLVPFDLIPCNCDGQIIEESKSLENLNNRPLNVKSGSCFLLNWHTEVDSFEYMFKNLLSPMSTEKEEDKCLKLSDLMQGFVDIETLDAEEAWFCGKCKKPRQAEKTLRIWQLPPLLIVQLKRFSYSSNMFRDKIHTAVDYPIEEFEMSPYLSPGAPRQETFYDLYAVVCHRGTPNSGHYVNFARLAEFGQFEQEIGWRYFDDDFVNKTDSARALDNKNAYLLFYKRRGKEAETIVNRYNGKKKLIDEKKREFEKSRAAQQNPL